eukprot:TRINITY_DN7706_c0_g1_i1.p1 TRINITY_DN7706_c0_g1~~TRINITY_DN7706_c0_g1_i1.p1  ORF type:complete len:302 (-),score=57.24 TRINITY_DN7706_c0_g1_i1:326-1231(-)
MAPPSWITVLLSGSAGAIITAAIARIAAARAAELKAGSKSTKAPTNGQMPPQQQLPPFLDEDVHHVVTSENGPGVLYPLTISAVVPRPIAFISSMSKDGVRNLSPYSYFNAVAHDPPILAIGQCWSKGKPKDSLANILETKEFVVSIISEWFVEAANHTCGPYPFEVDEMELAKLTPVASHMVEPPRVGESALNMECRLRHSYDVTNSKGDVTTTVVLGEVLVFHIAKSVSARTPSSGKLLVDQVKLRPVSRYGGNTYGAGSSFFDIPRPDAAGRYPTDSAFVPGQRENLLATPPTKNVGG